MKFRKITGVLLAAVLLTAVLTGCAAQEKKGAAENTGGEAARTVVKDADLVISKSDVTTTAKFYPVQVSGTKLEVLAVRAPDDTIRTAFNTCQVCYSSGRGFYKQDGDVLVCQNCGNRFKMSRVEIESGGCNPVPIFDERTTETEDSITISLDVLQEAKSIFANWKSEY